MFVGSLTGLLALPFIVVTAAVYAMPFCRRKLVSLWRSFAANHPEDRSEPVAAWHAMMHLRKTSGSARQRRAQSSHSIGNQLTALSPSRVSHVVSGSGDRRVSASASPPAIQVRAPPSFWSTL